MPEALAPGSGLKLPTRLIVYAWGEEYVDTLLSINLPAVLAPGNLPCIVSQVACEVVILTEERFFFKVSTAPAVARIRMLCPVRLVSLDDLIIAANRYGMSLTYTLHRGFSDLGPGMTDSWLIFLNADFILADGSLRSLLALLTRGERVVAAPSYCTVSSEVLPRLQERVDAETSVLAIPPREMAKLVLAHRHNTVIGKTINQKAFSVRYMDQFYWEVDRDTLIGHQMPVAIVGMRPQRYLPEPTAYWDYGIIWEFCPDADIYVIGDSDDFLMLELREKEVAQDQLSIGWPKPQELGQRMNMWVTPYQRSFASRPLTLHASDLPDGVAQARASLSAFVDEVLSYAPHDLPSHINHPQWTYHWRPFMEARHKYLAVQLGSLTEQPPPPSLHEVDKCWWQLDGLQKTYARKLGEIFRRFVRETPAVGVEVGVTKTEYFPSVILEKFNDADRASVSCGAGASSAAMPVGRVSEQFAKKMQDLDREFEASLPQLKANYEQRMRQYDNVVDAPGIDIQPQAEARISALVAAVVRSIFNRRPDISAILSTCKRFVIELIKRAFFTLFGRWPHVTMLSPYWAPLHPLSQILDRAATGGAKDVLIVGDQARLSPRLPAISGLNICVTPAALKNANLAAALNQPAKFDLCLCDLSFAELTKFSELYSATTRYMRPGGVVAGFYLNGDVAELPLDPANWAEDLRRMPGAKVHFCGSPLSTEALRAYRSAVTSNRAHRLAYAIRLVTRLPWIAIRSLKANRHARSAGENSQISPRDCSSITVEIEIPKQINHDDGTLYYAKAAGIYMNGAEAPTYPDRVVAADVAKSRDTVVIFTFGQSNAANLGQGHYIAKHPVYVFNVFDTQYYRAIDPLPGASNDGGSVWGRLGDRLVAAGYCHSVLFIPIAFGGSFIADWAPGGACHLRLQFALHRMESIRLLPDMLCWHQGEAEANHTNMSSDEYRHNFLAMLGALRDAGIVAPIYVATATLCANQEHPFKNHDEIRQAQKQLISTSNKILPGPDTDCIGIEHRWDGCHFSTSGLDLAADAWFESLTAHWVLTRRARRSES